MTYTITVRNNGPDTSYAVRVSDKLPKGMKYVTSNANYGIYDPLTGIWWIDYLPRGAVAILNITATVLRSGKITNTARFSSLTYDPGVDDKTASVTINAQERPIPVNGKTVTMKKTGSPLVVLVVAVLMVLGGHVYTKK